MSEARAAALLARLRAAGIDPRLDPDGGLALPSGTRLPKTDIRALNRQAGAVRRILIGEARHSRVADCPPPAARPASASDSGKRAVQEARRRLQQTAPDELAALEEALQDHDPAVAAAARSVLARLMAAALKAPARPAAGGITER